MQVLFVSDIHSAKLRRQSGGGWGTWNFWGTLTEKRNEAEKELKNSETRQMFWVNHLKFKKKKKKKYFLSARSDGGTDHTETKTFLELEGIKLIALSI